MEKKNKKQFKNNKKYTESSVLSEIINDPKGRKVLEDYNIPCLSCPFASLEIDKLRLGDICKAYKLDLNGILKKLNEEKDSKRKKE